MSVTCEHLQQRIKVKESTKWFPSHNKNNSKVRKGEPKSYFTENVKNFNALHANNYNQSDEVTLLINPLFEVVFLLNETMV